MTTSIPRVLMVLCAVLSSMVTLAGCASAPQYGVCEKQIVSHVEHQLKQHVTRLDVTYPTKRFNRNSIPLDRGTAVVHVDECDGYHVFDVLGTEDDCLHRPHYGKPPMYVWYRTSEGDC